MKVLWVCNLIPALIRRHLSGQSNAAANKEGWVSAAMTYVLKHEEIELAVAFPVAQEDGLHGEAEGISYYGFYEDTAHPEEYDPSLEGALGHICEEFGPEVIHCYGTEFPHTLAILRLPEWRSRVLIHLQGIMNRCAEYYMAGLPESVTERSTLRDFLRKDSIWQQKEKYEKRAVGETEACKLAVNVCGRTAFDKEYMAAVNPSCTYYSMNETLRGSFYGKGWNREECTAHRIFMSQGNIPLKGLHLMLEALPKILEKYPDTTLVVAGDDVVRDGGMINRIKLSEYGLYLRQLISKYHLREVVEFTGPLNEQEMLQEYLAAEVYVLPSYIENSPNSLGEAMLLGLPCVAADVGGVSSLAENEKEALLFPRGDVTALQNAILQVFDTPEAAQSMGAEARRRATLTHDGEANYKMLCWIYEAISGGRKR